MKQNLASIHMMFALVSVGIFCRMDVGGDTLDKEIKCFNVIVYKLV
jgi:hypothetical protein